MQGQIAINSGHKKENPTKVHSLYTEQILQVFAVHHYIKKEQKDVKQHLQQNRAHKKKKQSSRAEAEYLKNRGRRYAGKKLNTRKDQI